MVKTYLYLKEREDKCMTKERYDKLFNGFVVVMRWFIYLFCIFKLIRLNKFWAGLTALFFINSFGDVNQDLSEVGKWMHEDNRKHWTKDEPKDKANNTIQFGFCVNK